MNRLTFQLSASLRRPEILLRFFVPFLYSFKVFKIAPDVRATRSEVMQLLHSFQKVELFCQLWLNVLLYPYYLLIKTRHPQNSGREIIQVIRTPKLIFIIISTVLTRLVSALGEAVEVVGFEPTS